MALDRFISFDGCAVPSIAAVITEAERYTSGCGKVETDRCRVFITIPGESEAEDQNERFIEVYCGDTNIDVMTRSADELTNAIAEGFTNRIARKFHGTRELP